MIKKRSANILVFNSKKELALQLRAAHDDSFPSHWDFSAAGGIDAGEEPKECAVRELREELGVSADVTFIEELLFSYPAWGTNEPKEDYAYIYETLYDGKFSPDPGEVQEIRFFSLDDIATMIKSGQKFHPEFKTLWEKGTISAAAKDVS